MTTQMTDEESRIEREQVECVFLLGGGELNTDPTHYVFTKDGDKSPGVFRYTYDGTPEYAREDFDDAADDDARADYFTAVTECLWGGPPETIDVGGKSYTRVKAYASSGERECPCTDCDEDPYEGKLCPLCERAADETEHGFVYLGDGWCEVVYRHDGVEHLRQLAKRHNIQVWESREAMCKECGYCCASDCWPDGCEHDEGCSRVAADVEYSGEKRWWWETCSPGCLPDSEISGPFDTEAEALDDATEGLDDA